MILKVDEIHTFYGSSHILFGVSLWVDEGEVVCLLGRNGSGKTTTLRSIMGLTRPRSGSVILRGIETCAMPPYKKAKMGMSFVPADRKIIPFLTVHENLLLGERKNRHAKWMTDSVYELFPELKKFKDYPGGNLSGGQQQMLTIGRTLMCNPTVLLLDEPAEGLAPVIIDNLISQLKTLAQEGQTILLAEQNVRFATELSNRGYIIENGSIKYEGKIQELKENEEIHTKYLAV